ncbi:MAG: nucleotidyl transferase AbiEii/AbiGii toxin family protein [Candidatus Eisenbacteria bacterium]|nr:nucleotidyl transferase AbiEii/AbiGii toxin family protein [Candidatus Eisenbacteria bacterium]
MTAREGGYQTPRAFAQALDARLRNRSRAGSDDLVRFRRLVAFDRLLARLFHGEDGACWLVKGGYALEVRYGFGARSTRDMDLAVTRLGEVESSRESAEVVHQRLLDAAARDLKDFFDFDVSKPNRVLMGVPERGLGFPVAAWLDGRVFQSFAVDVVQDDPVTGEPEWKSGQDLLDFAGIPPARFRVVSREQHFAEKLHAYVRPRASAVRTRVKDLVDLVLFVERGLPEPRRLAPAVRTTFAQASPFKVEPDFPRPPADWARPYEALVLETGVTATTLDDAYRLLSQLWQSLDLT